MKKALRNTLMAIGLFLCIGNNNVFADDIRVCVDYKPLQLSQDVFINNDRVFVPLRNICESMGCNVYWDEATQQVKIERDFKNIVFTIGSKTMFVNNTEKEIDVEPKIAYNRTYIPLRALQEALGDEVTWDKDTRTVNIHQKDKAYINGEWHKIISLDKEYKKTIENSAAYAIIKVSVPQIQNPTNIVAIDKINEYYKEEGSECYNNFISQLADDKELSEWWNITCSPYSYELSYDIGYNANDILAVKRLLYMYTGGAHPNYSVVCDVFDVNTGNKLGVGDILNGTKEEIEQFIIDGFSKQIDENPDRYFKDSKDTLKESIRLVNYYLDNGDLVFMFDIYVIAPYASGIPEFRVNIKDNKDLFKKEFLDVYNYKEENNAINHAKDYFNDEVELVDKTTFKDTECYVFKHNDNLIAVDKNGEIVYNIRKDGPIYKVEGSKKIVNGITNRQALQMVMDKINNSEYSYEIGGYLLEDGTEYIIVVMQDMEEKTSSKVVVNKETGELSTYYFE